jgi:hypothetical protein
MITFPIASWNSQLDESLEDCSGENWAILSKTLRGFMQDAIVSFTVDVVLYISAVSNARFFLKKFPLLL